MYVDWWIVIHRLTVVGWFNNFVDHLNIPAPPAVE